MSMCFIALNVFFCTYFMPVDENIVMFAVHIFWLVASELGKLRREAFCFSYQGTRLCNGSLWKKQHR